MVKRRNPRGFFRSVVIVAAAGVATALAVQSHAGPFAKLTGAQEKLPQAAQKNPLDAASLYPAPPVPTPIVQTIVIQDPPPPPPVYHAAPASSGPKEQEGGSGQFTGSQEQEDQGGSDTSDD